MKRQYLFGMPLLTLPSSEILFLDLHHPIQHFNRKSTKWDNYKIANFPLDSHSKEE
jgi:hypothetical protein